MFRARYLRQRDRRPESCTRISLSGDEGEPLSTWGSSWLACAIRHRSLCRPRFLPDGKPISPWVAGGARPWPSDSRAPASRWARATPPAPSPWLWLPRAGRLRAPRYQTEQSLPALGDVDRVAVLDFGLARSGQASQAVTNTPEWVVGTPEITWLQSRPAGRTSLTAAADIFRGVVWFECLTGAPPFVGEHVAAVLAKVLFEPLPDVRTLRPRDPSRGGCS